MSRAALLVETLKKSLRQCALTYANVARTLGLSESSVKRLFAQKDLSLERTERICTLMKLDITDLLELMHAAEPRIAELTEEQERALVNEPKLLLVGILANELLQHRLQKLAEEFDSHVQEDKAVDHRMRTGTTMVLAIRPWEPSQFTELRRRVGDS